MSRQHLRARTAPMIPDDAVMDMIETVLDNNLFQFNGKEYLQTDGIAIGSKLGRNFACSYMRKWDEKLTEHKNQPIFYKRYIDDGFGVWLHGVEELQNLLQHANNIHPNIQVELRWSYKQIEFLDTLVQIKNGELITDLYTKPTDKHLYVDKKSSHPTNVKKAIPYGLAIRLKRICSQEEDYLRHRNELKGHLRKRGYSSRFLEQQLQRADITDRDTLLKTKTKRHNRKEMKRVPLVTTFQNQVPNIHSIVHKHMPTLHKSVKLQKVFDEPPLVAYRRDRNLADMLIHGKLNKVMSQSLSETGAAELRLCNNACIVCDMFQRGDPDNEFTNANRYGCQTRNAIYGIHCTLCNQIVYVGETCRTVRERLKEHEADVRHHREKPVAAHFNGHGHGVENMGVTVLERVNDTSRFYRQVREQEWIKRLNTILNTKVTLGVLWRAYR